ncbi:hypothetical protein K490DRAFT_64752 [Saccharata proteae CBS 121410]|uniref:C2H2-type domain-containing protein n=1 Tax=Saccharata proteae CBS 121410 TaxID=1314787 RepID=A0A9P4HX47_9PEZI|nr:hypothetical protein K490DRAFT_64752 [Saccharata proteae CBS 121410]
MDRSASQSGHEKQHGTQSPRGHGKEPPLASMTTRIAASASGLARDLVGSSSEAPLTIASGSGLSGKGQEGSSSIGSSNWSQSLPARQNGSSSHASYQNGEPFRPLSGFRESASTSRNELTGKEFDDINMDSSTLGMDEPKMNYNFFGSGEFAIDREVQRRENGQSPAEQYKTSASWAQEFQVPTQSSIHNALTSDWNRTNTGWSPLHQAVPYDDGAEVRLLLSDPTFSVDEIPSQMDIGEPSQETINDLFGQDFNETERQAVQKIKSTLPPPPVHKSMPADHPLNLRPEFAAATINNPELEREIAELSTTLNNESQMYFTPSAQRQQWLSEWEDVLNSYTDEVWGELLPTVRAAREQLQQVQNGIDRMDSKAVARLKMILGHVVESSQLDASAAMPATSVKAEETSQSLLANMHDLRQLHRPAHREVMREHTAQHPLKIPAREVMGNNSNQQQRRREKTEMAQESERPEPPTFHCPWVSCHERFHNEWDLRLHSSTHTEYGCPHVDCGDRFVEAGEWAEHINRAHHDLLDSRTAAQGDNEA